MKVQLFLVLKEKKRQSENDPLSDTLLTSVVQPTQLRCHILFPAGFWLFLIWEPRESSGNRWNAVLCSAEWSSIQFLCNFPPHTGAISLAWLRWELHMQKKTNSCMFLLVKYPISQCWALWILFSFPGPCISFAVSCCPSPCLHVVKLGVCMLEDVCLTVLPFSCGCPLPLILFLSVGSCCMKNTSKNTVRWLSWANASYIHVYMYRSSLNSVGRKSLYEPFSKNYADAPTLRSKLPPLLIFF